MSISSAELTTSVETFVKSLQPGDVLLFDSIGPVSQLIKLAENRPVNHSGIYLGNGDYAQVRGHEDAADPAALPKIAAARKGNLRERLTEQPGPYDRTVTALRHIRVLSGQTDVTPVVDRTVDYVQAADTRYSYLSLSGLMVPSLYRTFAPYLEGEDHSPAVRLFLKMLAQSFINNRTTVPKEKKSLTCSEFVYLCYKEAQPTLPIDVPSSLVRWPIDPEALAKLDRIRARASAAQRSPSKKRGPGDSGTRMDDVLTFHESLRPGLLFEAPVATATKRGPVVKMMIKDFAVMGKRAFLDVVVHNLGLSKYEEIVPGEIISDAVSPRDLWSSPSLRAVAVLHHPPDPSDSGLDLVHH